MSFIVTKKNLKSAALFALIIGVLLFTSLGSLEFTFDKAVLTAGFLVISLISFMSIVADTRIMSMNKFHWYFQLVFMGLAPMCQYLSGYYPWGVAISVNDMQAAQAIVGLFDILFILFYRGHNGWRTNLGLTTKVSEYLTCERTYPTSMWLISIIVGSVAFALLVSMIGFYNLFFRSENVLDIENSTLNFVVRKFLTALPAMLFSIMVSVNRNRRNVLNVVAILILIVFAVCSNFPTSTTRYWMGTIFLGGGILLFNKRNSSRIIDYVVLIVLLVGFPVFYVFKNSSVDIITTLQNGVEYNGIVESFNTIDFDAFTLIARGVRYVRENGVTYGAQLINIILFFIPRSIWTAKPITTNVLIASSINQTFTNLSAPLPVEGYVNFGVIGVVLYAVITARFCRLMDKLFWEMSELNKVNLVNMFYPFLCVILIYIERGPLQPSFIQTIALLLPLFAVSFFCGRKVK